jgi:hypothetical protein
MVAIGTDLIGREPMAASTPEAYVVPSMLDERAPDQPQPRSVEVPQVVDRSSDNIDSPALSQAKAAIDMALRKRDIGEEIDIGEILDEISSFIDKIPEIRESIAEAKELSKQQLARLKLELREKLTEIITKIGDLIYGTISDLSSNPV